MKPYSLGKGLVLSALSLSAVLSISTYPVLAADIRFAVQPIMDAEATRIAYQPLADYIATSTGKTVELITSRSYLEYWVHMKSGKSFNLILDAPFYTDFRIKQQGHVPLVKVPGVISNSVVTRADSGIFDVSELVGKRVATITPPSPGSLILQKLFPNPTRQPFLMSARDSEHALELVLSGKAIAAIIPTPLAGQAMSQGKEIFTVMTTPPIPHIAFTAGPDIDVDTRDKITKALLEAKNSPEGRKILKLIGFPEGFEPATSEIYLGYSEYLNKQW